MIKVRILRWEVILDLSRWSLNATTVVPCKREVKENLTHRRGRHNITTVRDWCDVAISQGMLVGTRS